MSWPTLIPAGRWRKPAVLVLLAIGMVFAVTTYHFSRVVMVNVGNSMDGVLYLKQDITAPVRVGDYIYFSHHLNRYAPEYAKVTIKVVAGVGDNGDTLDTLSNGDVLINGNFVCRAMKYDGSGNPMNIFKYTGQIPKGKYFVYTPNPFSYDSRYWGFLSQEDVRGKLKLLL